MPIETALALAAATFALVLVPGPNMALFIGAALRHGFLAGATTVAGTVAGNGLQVALVLGGLSMLLAVAASALVWIKWIGVAYLLAIGIMTLRQAPAEGATELRAPPAGRSFAVGVGIAILNPKTLLFIAAFLPQFVTHGIGPWGYIAPALVYLGVAAAGDLMLVALAGQVAPRLRRWGPWRNRLAGSLFIASGVGLALSRVGR